MGIIMADTHGFDLSPARTPYRYDASLTMPVDISNHYKENNKDIRVFYHL